MLDAERAGTGAGEGALSQAAQSMLADYFPKERLPAALGLFSMGIYVGNGLALVLGGAVTAAAVSLGVMHVAVLGDVRPWQLVFFVAGAPGLVLAVLLLAIREPARRGMGAHCACRHPGVQDERRAGGCSIARATPPARAISREIAPIFQAGLDRRRFKGCRDSRPSRGPAASADTVCIPIET